MSLLVSSHTFAVVQSNFPAALLCTSVAKRCWRVCTNFTFSQTMTALCRPAVPHALSTILLHHWAAENRNHRLVWQAQRAPAAAQGPAQRTALLAQEQAGFVSIILIGNYHLDRWVLLLRKYSYHATHLHVRCQSTFLFIFAFIGLPKVSIFHSFLLKSEHY